jgi:lysozyme family protein
MSDKTGDDTSLRCSSVCHYINNCGMETADCPLERHRMTLVPYTWQDRLLLALIVVGFVYEAIAIIGY